MVRYLIKILWSSDNCLPKKIYSMLKNDLDNNSTYNSLNWAFQIKISEIVSDLTTFGYIKLIVISLLI